MKFAVVILTKRYVKSYLFFADIGSIIYSTSVTEILDLQHSTLAAKILAQNLTSGCEHVQK
jgi:hypothetical protein